MDEFVARVMKRLPRGGSRRFRYGLAALALIGTAIASPAPGLALAIVVTCLLAATT